MANFQFNDVQKYSSIFKLKTEDLTIKLERALTKMSFTGTMGSMHRSKNAIPVQNCDVTFEIYITNIAEKISYLFLWKSFKSFIFTLRFRHSSHKENKWVITKRCFSFTEMNLINAGKHIILGQGEETVVFWLVQVCLIWPTWLLTFVYLCFIRCIGEVPQ